MQHLIVGTAGHVDHGKTSLIRALTGINTDRLKEEKKRGLSIELGFAFLNFDDGITVGIVDVPGHEKFINNMLTGAHAMGLILFVVSAKEGIQEQSLEHLELIDLLGKASGILVMTKCDLATKEELQENSEMASELLMGTVLENSPIVNVSTATNEGIDRLRAMVHKFALANADKVPPDAIPRLYVDRVFTMPGFGVVATGTLTGGTMKRDEYLRLLPSNDKVRIRGIQVHGQTVQIAQANQRVALNLTGISKDKIKRGDLLCPLAIDRTSDKIDLSIDILRSFPQLLEHWTKLRIHIGTSEIFCRAVMLVEPEILPGESALLQLQLEKPSSVFKGDRVILRDFTAKHTIGGGEIIDPFPPRRKRFKEETVELLKLWKKADGPMAMVNLIARQTRNLAVEEELLRYYFPRSEKTFRQELDRLEQSGEIICWQHSGKRFIAESGKVEKIELKLIGQLKSYHARNPLRLGKNSVQQLEELGLTLPAFEMIIDRLIGKNRLVKSGNLLRLKRHQIEFSPEDKPIKIAIENFFRSEKLQLRTIDETISQLSEFSKDRVREVFRALVSLGNLLKIRETVFIHAENFESHKNLLVRKLDRDGKIEIVDFRELAETNRKHAVWFLEYCDRQKITMREGNVRRLRRAISHGEG